MAMELLTFHNQFVAHLVANDENDNLISLDILQGTQISRPQLELGQGICTQSLNCFRELRRLMLQHLLYWNNSRSAAIGKSFSWVENDPYFTGEQASEHNRGDTLQPFTWVFEVSCHDERGKYVIIPPAECLRN